MRLCRVGMQSDLQVARACQSWRERAHTQPQPDGKPGTRQPAWLLLIAQDGHSARCHPPARLAAGEQADLIQHVDVELVDESLCRMKSEAASESQERPEAEGRVHVRGLGSEYGMWHLEGR